MAKWSAEWSGKFPILCLEGEWTLYKDGEKVETHIPFQGGDAGTFNQYDSWHFEDWLDVWEEEESGMKEKEWIAKYHEWLSTIADESEFPAIFKAFQESDFRPNSCGGCI